VQTSIIGIDPGLVDTGCVGLVFNEADRTIEVNYGLLTGVDLSTINWWIDKQPKAAAIFIEDYNPGNFGKTDKDMVEAMGKLKAELPPADHPHLVKYVDNAGINTLVPRAVLLLFGVNKFDVKQHHNDLVSAGKIAILGMMQDKSQHSLRLLASQVVADAIRGKPWNVMVHA
jgi:hypothetical protein